MCDIRCRMLTYDIIRDVRCRTYDVVRLYSVYRTYDIARTMYNTMSYVARTTSYVMHVRHRICVRHRRWQESRCLASFLQDSDHIPPLLPGTFTAALVPSRGQTALHCPVPSGVRAGHGPPGHLPIGSGRLGVPVAHLGQANSDPFPGHIPARHRPLGYRQNTRLGPTRILASSHVT
jgi:hypothetical protein